MPVIKVVANPNEIVPWCEENISAVLWKRIGLEWHGRGWCIESPNLNQDLEYDYLDLDRDSKRRFDVDIDDEYQAIMFALTWS